MRYTALLVAFSAIVPALTSRFVPVSQDRELLTADNQYVESHFNPSGQVPAPANTHPEEDLEVVPPPEEHYTPTFDAEEPPSTGQKVEAKGSGGNKAVPNNGSKRAGTLAGALTKTRPSTGKAVLNRESKTPIMRRPVSKTKSQTGTSLAKKLGSSNAKSAANKIGVSKTKAPIKLAPKDKASKMKSSVKVTPKSAASRAKPAGKVVPKAPKSKSSEKTTRKPAATKARSPAKPPASKKQPVGKKTTSSKPVSKTVTASSKKTPATPKNIRPALASQKSLQVTKTAVKTSAMTAKKPKMVRRSYFPMNRLGVVARSVQERDLE